MYCSRLPTLYTRSSDGQTVMPLLRGTTCPPVPRILGAHWSEQNTGLGGSPHTDNAFTYCVHASPITFTLQALHTCA